MRNPMSAGQQSDPLAAWMGLLSEEGRRLVLFLLSHSVLEPALRSPWIVDVAIKGAADGLAPLLPDTIALEIAAGDLGNAHRTFDGLDGDQPCILLRNVLQHLPDYRSFIGGAFDRLAIGGYLIVIVPHQFLYERKLQAPSRYDRRHLRFYTPARSWPRSRRRSTPVAIACGSWPTMMPAFDYEAPLHAVPGRRPRYRPLPAKARAAALAQGDGSGRKSERRLYSAEPLLPPYEAEADAYRVIAPDDRGFSG